MRIREILDIAKTTELKQIAVGADDDYVISLLNLALIEVYGRFGLIQEEQTITVYPGRTRYLLQDNMLRIMGIYDQDGKELPVDDPNDPRSVYNPTPYEIHVTEPHMKGGSDTPYDKPLTRMSVLMSTTPPYITKENVDTVDLIVPPWALEPILAYMAYRAYISMNGDQQTEYTAHLARYEKAVIEVYQKGFLNQNITTNMKTVERGFV